MSRFDDEGAPLVTRTVTARWNLPVDRVQRILRPLAATLGLQWESHQERKRHREPPPEDLEPPETYDEHGKRLHPHEEERVQAPHIDLEG